ncbi:hypothetical protein BG74_08265 [Sodalis-like endosymbiont of Proechinophthirus fluctus]|uniref:hypothetical protein n=1 Tax=Sodalis-like endosymbiont of Proechinophthirus fluctus TaxID=1462730 RepID=UPI0007A928AE|nr:hypothetical protein [Sodalis-like endosymbiont of Proechinophthirus fluctus]KYP95758.1 hypothetical protein BG74_08265 [Sodalis-like endosymbiont of Proechinophthirus fluctus]
MTAPLAIQPYPCQLESVITLNNGQICLFQLIMPEDELLLKTFIGHVNSRSPILPLLHSEISEFIHEYLAYMMQIDYDREMAFVAVSSNNKIVKSSSVITLVYCRFG